MSPKLLLPLIILSIITTSSAFAFDIQTKNYDSNMKYQVQRWANYIGLLEIYWTEEDMFDVGREAADYCTGILVDNRVVLSAASCFYDPHKKRYAYEVIFRPGYPGENATTMRDAAGTEVSYASMDDERMAVTSEWKNGRLNYKNNLGVVQLTERFYSRSYADIRANLPQYSTELQGFVYKISAGSERLPTSVMYYEYPQDVYQAFRNTIQLRKPTSEKSLRGGAVADIPLSNPGDPFMLYGLFVDDPESFGYKPLIFDSSLQDKIYQLMDEL